MPTPRIELHHGDCLEVMKDIPDGSIDLVLTDPPYGTTACKWDSIIPLEPMWEQLKRIAKQRAAIVMTAGQPFTTALIASNMKGFKYCWHWNKGYSMGFANCNKMPMKRFEDICVFYELLPKYKPQGLIKIKPVVKTRGKRGAGEVMGVNGLECKAYTSKFTNYPTDEIKTKKEKTMHPTGKPVALMEYMIRTYSNEGDTILDFTMGSGTTGIACKNTNRNFIGIEKDGEIFATAKERIENHEPSLT